jgi:hypothetical protein
MTDLERTAMGHGLDAVTVAIAAGLLVSACGVPPAGNRARDAREEESGDRSASQREPEPRIDLRPLVGADKRAVARMLGQPRSCRTESRGESCAFGQPSEPGDATEVFFINGRAANLTLPNFDMPYEAASLRAYGIDAGEAAVSSPDVMRWYTNIGSTPVEVNMFPGSGGRIFYLYVMVRE